MNSSKKVSYMYDVTLRIVELRVFLRGLKMVTHDKMVSRHVSNKNLLIGQIKCKKNNIVHTKPWELNHLNWRFTITKKKDKENKKQFSNGFLSIWKSSLFFLNTENHTLCLTKFFFCCCCNMCMYKCFVCVFLYTYNNVCKVKN